MDTGDTLDGYIAGYVDGEGCFSIASGLVVATSIVDASAALVYVVRERRALLHSVIPFFERVPLLSSKRLDFEKFADIVRNMARAGTSLPPASPPFSRSRCR
jgi:hypothetical protein